MKPRMGFVTRPPVTGPRRACSREHNQCPRYLPSHQSPLHRSLAWVPHKYPGRGVAAFEYGPVVKDVVPLHTIDRWCITNPIDGITLLGGTFIGLRPTRGLKGHPHYQLMPIAAEPCDQHPLGLIKSHPYGISICRMEEMRDPAFLSLPKTAASSFPEASTAVDRLLLSCHQLQLGTALKHKMELSSKVRSIVVIFVGNLIPIFILKPKVPIGGNTPEKLHASLREHPPG